MKVDAAPALVEVGAAALTDIKRYRSRLDEVESQLLKLLHEKQALERKIAEAQRIYRATRS